MQAQRTACSAVPFRAGSQHRHVQRSSLRVACGQPDNGGGARGGGKGGGVDGSVSTTSSQLRRGLIDGSADGSNKEAPSPGLGLKAVWMGAEAFGNVLGASKGNQMQAGASSAGGPKALSRPAAIAALKADYDLNYFISGLGSMSAYAPDCLFADPFAGFNGVDRFKRNVSNLGGLMQDIQLDVTGWEEGEDSLTTNWRFSATLDLPWKPRLAAAGGTSHVFDKDSGLVVKHIESWDVEPGRVVRSLLKPSAKVPSTQAEVLMSSVHDGDVAGVWFAISSKVATVAAPASILLLVLHLFRGEGLGAWEAAAYLGFVGGLGTELYKIVRGAGM